MLSKCCCCVSLRTGSIIIGVLGLLGGIACLANAVYSGFNWIGLIQGIVYILSYGCLLYGAIRFNRTAVIVYLVIDGVMIAAVIIFGILAIVGVSIVAGTTDCSHLQQEVVDFPYSSDQINMQAWNLKQMCESAQTVVIGITAGIFFISAMLSFYFWICVYSFYKELNMGMSNPV